MKNAVEMLGAGPAEVVEVRASTDGNCLDLETRYCVTHWRLEGLLFDFSGYVNRFEGTCKAAGYYYAITPKMKGTSDYDILQQLEASGTVTQYWIYAPTNDDGDHPPVSFP